MRASTSSNRPPHCGRPSSNVYCHTGIGGAGNYHRQVVITGPPGSTVPNRKDRSTVPRSFRSLLSSAISGASNIRHSANLTSLSPSPEEEEYAVASTRPSRFPVRWFTGIGSRRAGHKLSSSISSADDMQSDPSDGSGKGPADYRSQALPYGAADIIKWRVGEVLLRRK